MGIDSVLGFVALIYWVGAFVALFVCPHRVGGNRYAYVTVFMHPPSRRNGIPWLAKTIVKIFGWPILWASGYGTAGLRRRSSTARLPRSGLASRRDH